MRAVLNLIKRICWWT